LVRVCSRSCRCVLCLPCCCTPRCLTSNSGLFAARAQNMRLVGGVTVSFSTGTSICLSSAVVTTTIVFQQNAGNLPQLKAVGQVTNGVVTYATTLDGTKDNFVCNNRGLCDEALGTCVCFGPWASSDGQGNLGFLGDCGARSGLFLSLLSDCPSRHRLVSSVE
jgi:hypothetical protein